jgi:NADPH:quinone reductase-like Zn-dependent oxidoreductase
VQNNAYMPANTAAWFVSARAKLKVSPAPYTPPGEGEIVIRNRAVAINPVDWAIATLPFIGPRIVPWLKTPAVLGEDLAGEVAEVGPGVTRFEVGDRVVAFAAGGNANRNRSSEGAFQKYVVVLAHMASPIPDTLSYAEASVLPLGLSTAACGLFQKDFLALQHPSADARPTGKTLLIWGGATSVGCNAIQLAVNAGYDVFTTASPQNADYLKSLGASRVFDYHRKNVVNEIVEALKGKTIAGAFAIATGSTSLCLDIVHRAKGDKFVAVAAGPIPLAKVGAGGTLQVLPLLPRMLFSGLSDALKARTRSIGTKFIWGGSLVDNEVGPAVFVDFLPRALAEGRFATAPPAVVVGAGLEAIEAGFAAQRRGVSAKKVVISLDP